MCSVTTTTTDSAKIFFISKFSYLFNFFWRNSAHESELGAANSKPLEPIIMMKAEQQKSHHLYYTLLLQGACLVKSICWRPSPSTPKVCNKKRLSSRSHTSYLLHSLLQGRAAGEEHLLAPFTSHTQSVQLAEPTKTIFLS